MNNFELSFKPVFNYDISVMDRVNQITNRPKYGTVRMIFAASMDNGYVLKALVGCCAAGICVMGDFSDLDNSGTDQDLYYEVLVSSNEDYKILIRELITSWDIVPLATSYTPSKEEVGL